MGFNESILVRRRDELNDRGVRMRFIGRRDWRVPKRVHPAHGRVDRADQGQPADDLHHRLQLRRPGRDRRRGAGDRRGEGHARQGRPRRRSAGTSTTPRCPTPTSWSAPRASTASPTSCCGSWPTASWSSPTCCGPTSAASTSSTPCASTRRASAASAVSSRRDRSRRMSRCTATRASCCAPTSWARPTASSCSSPSATARCGRWPRACARPRASSGSRSSRTSHVPLQLYEGRELDIVTQAETVDHFRAIRDDLDRFARAVAMLEAVDQVAQEREPNPRLYQMLLGALRTLAARQRPARRARLLLQAAGARGVPARWSTSACECGARRRSSGGVRPRARWCAVRRAAAAAGRSRPRRSACCSRSSAAGSVRRSNEPGPRRPTRSTTSPPAHGAPPRAPAALASGLLDRG